MQCSSVCPSVCLYIRELVPQFYPRYQSTVAYSCHIQTERSESIACIEKFFIWRDIFTKFGMSFFLMQRYNFQSNRFERSTIAYSCHKNFLIKLNLFLFGKGIIASVQLKFCIFLFSIKFCKPYIFQDRNYNNSKHARIFKLKRT